MGLGCIFLASKVEDIYPLTLKQVLDSFGSSKFTARELTLCEWNILQLLDCQVCPPLVIDAVEKALYQIMPRNEQHNVYWESCLKYLRILQYHHEVTCYSAKVLSRSLILYVFTLTGALFYENMRGWNQYLNTLLDQLNWNQQELYDCLQQISKIVKHFPNSEYGAT